MTQRHTFTFPAWIFIATSAVGCLVLLARAAEPEQAMPAEKTDYVFDDPKHPEAPGAVEAERAQLEESLWAHWTEHREGKFQATAYSIEGDRGTTTFLFENDAQSRWCVRVDSVFYIRDRSDPGGRVLEDRSSAEYYDVKQIDAKTGHTVHGAEKRDATTYALLFINKQLHLKWKY